MLVVVLGGRVGFVVYLFTSGLVWLFVSVVCFTGWVFVELAVLLTLLLIGVLDLCWYDRFVVGCFRFLL